VPGLALLALYDEAMPRVYGYLLSRSGDRSLAEDPTADTFLAAADAIVRASQSSPSTAWLIGVARHKLAATGGGRNGKSGVCGWSMTPPPLPTRILGTSTSTRFARARSSPS
jgi:hypothetical protein